MITILSSQKSLWLHFDDGVYWVPCEYQFAARWVSPPRCFFHRMNPKEKFPVPAAVPATRIPFPNFRFKDRRREQSGIVLSIRTDCVRGCHARIPDSFVSVLTETTDQVKNSDLSHHLDRAKDANCGGIT